jgi:hypothetical protein
VAARATDPPCLIVGVTSTIAYGLIGVRFWPVLGLWDGVARFIPILGPWLGAVPPIVIALTQSWQTAALVVVFIALLQLTENAVLMPRVMRGAVGLTRLTVFVAILAGTELARVAGALLAIPVSAAIQVLLSRQLEARREAKLAGFAVLPGWRWMHGSAGLSAFESGIPTVPESGVATLAPVWSAEVLTWATSRAWDEPLNQSLESPEATPLGEAPAKTDERREA